MKRLLKVVFWGATAVLAVVLYVMPRMLESSIPSVYYVTPDRKTYENSISCTGTIQAHKQSTVYLRTPIVPGEIMVSVGDEVMQGDVLVQIDAEASALYGGLVVDQVSDLQPQSVSDSIDIDWTSLASAYGLSAVVSGITDSGSLNQILQDGLSGVQTESETVFVTDEVITAPITGTVTEVYLRQDMPASAGSAVVTLSDNSSYRVLAQVNESDIAGVSAGDSVTIRGVAFAGKSFTGTVTKVYPTARKVLSGTSTETIVDVEIQMDQVSADLKPGFTAKVEISGGEDFLLMTVPYEAIRQDENNNEYVYVYEDGRIMKRNVITGREMTNEVQILSGLTDESIVIYNPGEIIREGSMIQLKGRADVN